MKIRIPTKVLFMRALWHLDRIALLLLVVVTMGLLIVKACN